MASGCHAAVHLLTAGSLLWACTLPPCAPAFPAVCLFLEEPPSFVWIIGGTRLRQCTGEYHRTQAAWGECLARAQCSQAVPTASPRCSKPLPPGSPQACCSLWSAPLLFGQVFKLSEWQRKRQPFPPPAPPEALLAGELRRVQVSKRKCVHSCQQPTQPISPFSASPPEPRSHTWPHHTADLTQRLNPREKQEEAKEGSQKPRSPNSETGSEGQRALRASMFTVPVPPHQLEGGSEGGEGGVLGGWLGPAASPPDAAAPAVPTSSLPLPPSAVTRL